MKKISLKMKNSLLDSFKYGETEILNTTTNWPKKSPILFPAIGLGKSFDIKGTKYNIPKHGFWNDIKFDVGEFDNGFVLNGEMDQKEYPFYAQIDQYILIDKNTVSYRTTFTGPEIPMQFGYHPAFNYDLGGLKLKYKDVNVVLKDGTPSKMDIDSNNINDLPWDTVDTFILETKEVVLENNDYNVVVDTNMKYIAIWTNGDKFVCIEPWSNLLASVQADDNTIMNSEEYIMNIRIEEK